MGATMIRTVIRDGQISVNVPGTFEDGAEVLVQVNLVDDDGDQLIHDQSNEEQDRVMLGESDWDNSSEGIADWLRWYDSLEPLLVEEPGELAAESAISDWDKANQRAEQIAKEWQ